MEALYVASTQAYSGKSALCVALADHFQKGGLRIGYMKPVSGGARLGPGLEDEDANFVREFFALPDALADMAPIALGPGRVERILRGEPTLGLEDGLRAAFERVALGRDLIVLEGGCSLRQGALIGLPAARVAELVGARVLLVVKYEEDLQLVDDALLGRTRLGERCLGVVLNSVPRPRMRFVQELVQPALVARGVRVLAVLPLERLLLSVSVAELAGFLSGDVLCRADRQEELVEHLMVGAMGVERALSYFRRKPNKAVLTGGDRSDIQLAALETSTKCLILTGGVAPSPIILARAEEVGVPMILVRQDTLTAVETIERYFGKTRFHQAQKVHRFEELLADRFDFETLYRALERTDPDALPASQV